MKTFKKPLAILLAVMLAFSMFTIGITASAEETTPQSHEGTISAVSNVAATQTVAYQSYNDSVIVTYKLQSIHKIVNTQAYLDYDPNVLQPVLTESDDEDYPLAGMMPVLGKGNAVYNDEVEGKVYLNASKINFFNFNTEKVYIAQKFNIIGTGNTTVTLNVEVLTGSDQADYNQANSTNDIAMINQSESRLPNDFTFTCTAEVTGEAPVEPTTAEPTTVAPTTAEPTTAAPTEEPTAAPTAAPTEPATEPATEVVPTDTTIKLVVPNNINSAYAWSDARLYYNNTGKSADNQYINMTAANETYYMTELGDGIAEIASAGAWKVFTVTVTPEQATAIDGALWVGFANGNNRNKTVSEKAKNVLKAGVGAFDAAYGNAKASVADFDGYTFVIKDNNSTTSPYSSFLGYWTSDFTTVMTAAPMSDNSYSNWNAVSLSYGASGDSETAVPMYNTGSTTKVSDIGDMSTLRAGRWYIYAVTLDAAQTAAVNAAARVGFVKPGGNNRTAGSKNVLKAKTNSFDGNYNSTARTLEELEGQLFVVKAKASANSVVIYNGEWETEDVYTAGNADTVRIFFAAPKGADKTTAGWDTGVELYYGNTTAYQNCARMEMTSYNAYRGVDVAGTGLTTLKSGDWMLYTIELNAEQISAIDAATTVGFIKKGSYNRTSALYTKNIAKAPTTEDGTYSKNKQSIEAFDGKVFVINTCADAKNERTSYMGIWS